MRRQYFIFFRGLLFVILSLSYTRSHAQLLLPSLMQIHVSDERITLLTYKPHIAIDTIVEAGDYELMIRHDRDIHAIQLWRNGKKVKRPKFKDNRPTAALYRSLRTWMVRPTLRFGPQTVYLIQVQLEGESSERVYRLMTRPPNRPRPPKNELGIPIGQTD